MCELLALSTSRPAHLTFSLHTLASHGGAAGIAHGTCRVVFQQGEEVALFREDGGCPSGDKRLRC